MSVFSDWFKNFKPMNLLGDLGSSALGALGAWFGQHSQYKYNKRLQDDAQDFNSAEAAKNRDWQTLMNRENNQFNAAQAELARQFQEDFYLKYQSPAAMMSQYKDAGLNPVLAAGYATNTPPSASSASAGSSPSAAAATSGMNGVGPMDLIGSIASIMKLKAEINLINSEAQKNRSSSEKDYSGIRVDNATIKQMSIQNEQTLNSISNDNKRVENEVRHINGILSQIVESNKVTRKQVEEIDAQIKRMSVQNALDEQQKITLCAQQVLLEFQAEESGMRQHEILSKTRLNNAQANAMSETLYEQRFKNKYLSLYGRLPASETVVEARNWATKHGKKFEPYE